MSRHDDGSTVIDIGEFGRVWIELWDSCPPVVGLLRRRFHGQRLRFDSLPNGRSYPSSESDEHEILHRSHSMIDFLVGHVGTIDKRPVRIVSCSWSGQENVVERDALLARPLPDATYWQSYDLATEPGFHSWEHNFVSQIASSRQRMLEQALLLLANDSTDGLIILDTSADWLYVPFNGGMDVFIKDDSTRNRFESLFRRWRTQGHRM